MWAQHTTLCARVEYLNLSGVVQRRDGITVLSSTLCLRKLTTVGVLKEEFKTSPPPQGILEIV